MIKKEIKTRWCLITALIVTAVLITFPVRSLLAGFYHYRTSSLLKATGNTGEEIEKYMRNHIPAMRSLDTAAWLLPSQSRYRKAQSELHLRMATWAKVIETVEEPLPPGLPPSTESFARAETALQSAIRLEPTNPDYHYALGVLYDIMNSHSGLSEQEFARAVSMFPVNSGLRYAVALQHLNAGRHGDALEHATALAQIEGRSFASNNRPWLFKAFEIAWRATKDAQVVQGISPENREALKVLKEYLKWKGIE